MVREAGWGLHPGSWDCESLRTLTGIGEQGVFHWCGHTKAGPLGLSCSVCRDEVLVQSHPTMKENETSVSC